MTAIDTSKLVCPPLRNASEREWHLYNAYRCEQSNADAYHRELLKANRKCILVALAWCAFSILTAARNVFFFMINELEHIKRSLTVIIETIDRRLGEAEYASLEQVRIACRRDLAKLCQGQSSSLAASELRRQEADAAAKQDELRKKFATRST